MLQYEASCRHISRVRGRHSSHQAVSAWPSNTQCAEHRNRAPQQSWAFLQISEPQVRRVLLCSVCAVNHWGPTLQPPLPTPTPQPTEVLPTHTSCVKWPVDLGLRMKRERAV